MEETFYVTFSEDDEAILQTSTKGDAINFIKVNSFSNDKFNVVLALDEAVHPEPAPTLSHLIYKKMTEMKTDGQEKHIELVNIIGELWLLIEALKEEGWVLAMTEELNKFKRNKVWTLVLKPYGNIIIGLKWVFRNKMDEEGVMDVKSAFLNGKISKEVYVEQPLGFESSEFPNHVCKLNKDLYQANPKESHLVAVKRTFRYLKSTPNLGLWYPKGSGFDLKAYSDSDYAGCNLDKKTKPEYVAFAGCCAQVLWIKSQPTDYDVLYDKEFLYTAKVEEETNTITFSLSWWDEALSFTQTEFISTIRLPICKNPIHLPPKETVRAGLATLACHSAKAPTNLKTKKKKIPSFSQPKSPHKVKVILPKKQVTETQHAEVIVATVDTTKSLESSKLAKEKGNQPSTADTKKIEEDAEDKSIEIPTVEQLLDEVDKQNKAIQETPESPYDTESKIKVVKSDFTSQIPKLKDPIMHDSDESANYESMPEDDLRSVLGFKGDDSDNTQGNDVSHSDHTAGNHGNSIIHQMSDGIQSTLPALSDKFARLETKLSNTLKTNMGKSVTTLVKSVIVDDTAAEEKNKKAKDLNPTATQGEP
uniref:Reverse transcriptase Ty1/copia-type domain-containing protein n=1 Tax=Tanacetum cinerariifolium TaxID=118510 RepID=A0A6L2JRD8_TANCI|nr:hypothetical protein [Tanacetum cinerariifolium]